MTSTVLNVRNFMEFRASTGNECRKLSCTFRENRMGGFQKGGVSNNRFVLKPDVAIASEVSILSKNSFAITDFHAKKTQHVQQFENPLPGTPPFAIPNHCLGNDDQYWFYRCYAPTLQHQQRRKESVSQTSTGVTSSEEFLDCHLY